MRKPLISIILPVYNVERFLRSSLDSILCQDTSDCEILLINDGSTDDSLSILREYEKDNSNIRVIDKTNEGVSATRNRGLDECNGEYFYFMDSDDRLHPQLLALLRREIQTSHPDIVVWDFTTFYTQPKFVAIPENPIIEQVENGKKEAFNYLMAKGSAVSLCSKAIRRSLVGDIVRIDPSMTYGEDMFFCWKAILLAENIRYIRLPLYYYLQSGCGATNRFHPNLYEHYKKAFDDISSFVKRQGWFTNEVVENIDFHFACRIPSLTNMEVKAPYSFEQKKAHLALILQDKYIQRGIHLDDRLNGKLYVLAREGNVEAMLKDAYLNTLKSRILSPLKKLFK